MEKKNQNENGNRKIYSPEKLAEIMEVRKPFVMRLLREGKLKGFKMGKFWRISDENLQAFLATMNENGNGKKRMTADTKNKMRFHASLKSQKSLPDSFMRVEETILQLKDRLQEQTGYEKIATIAKLQSAVMLREELKEKLSSMDATLNAIGSKAYPELMDLADKDADTLEELFVKEAQSPKKSMVDFLHKGALEMVANHSEDEKEVVKAAENQNA